LAAGASKIFSTLVIKNGGAEMSATRGLLLDPVR